MTNKVHDVGAAKHLCKSRDAIETAAAMQWLPRRAHRAWRTTARFPKAWKPGSVLAWKHILAILGIEGMSTRRSGEGHDLIDRCEGHSGFTPKVRGESRAT